MNDKPKTCYISGPMTGIPENNEAAFMAAEERLVAMGYKVINPIRLSERFRSYIKKGWNREPTWIEYIASDLECEAHATHIHYLPGHEDSPGSQIEAIAAKKLDLVEVLLPDTERRIGE